MEKERIILIGMPASGKSYAGAKLARKLNYTFADLDIFIEEMMGESILDIFYKYGEEYFRKIERKYLKELLQLKQVVIATGGGTPCFYDNIALMNAKGLTIYLDKSLTFLYENVKKEEKRPMFIGLKKAEIMDKLNEIRISRKKFYEKCKIKVNNYKEVENLLLTDNQ